MCVEPTGIGGTTLADGHSIPVHANCVLGRKRVVCGSTDLQDGGNRLWDVCVCVLRGMLSKPGGSSIMLQKALTAEREAARFQRLDVAIRAPPFGDMRQAAWTNLDRYSTSWIPPWPKNHSYVSNTEFGEVATFYYGLRLALSNLRIFSW